MLALTLNATPQTTSTVEVINEFLGWDIFADTIIWVGGFLIGVLVLGFIIKHLRK